MATGPRAARASRIIARVASASPRSHENPLAVMPSAASAEAAAASRSPLRATSATAYPSRPNRRATASEMPGPCPHTTMVLFTPVAYHDDARKSSGWRRGNEAGALHHARLRLVAAARVAACVVEDE